MGVVPSDPGPNLPPVGHSLFDQLFAVRRDGQSRIEPPFPFAALLARIDARLAPAPPGSLPPIKRVLIPLGRSLQRTAAAPDYFSFPRVVATVDGKNAPNSQIFLKDRLYIGYQEKSAVLEVISYNEAAGRFEFQLVKDYRAGGKPQVFYANRTLCFACHQNGAPIFSRALWDETNANPQTAALLAASGRSFYGIRPDRGVDIPYAIDNATERANGFALTQLLWREGCGGNDLPARRCRAGLFSEALRHALSGGQRRTAFGEDFQRGVEQPLRRNARQRWPNGLAIGSPDLPNRNPLAGTPIWPSAAAARIAHSHVAAPFDPLLPRPPFALWQADAPNALPVMIAGLAEFVADADRERLIEALGRQPAETVRLSSPCQISATPSRWSIQCRPAGGQSGPELSADLSIRGGLPTDGRITRLRLPDGSALTHLDLLLPEREHTDATRFTLQQSRQTPRTALGHALSRLSLQRDVEHPEQATVTVEIRADFTTVEQALTDLPSTAQGERLLGAAPLPRAGLIDALLGRLGAPAQAASQTASALPEPRLEVAAIPPGSSGHPAATQELQGFHAYCASCHQSAETFPPNFLSGDPGQVTARLRQCAPRLYVRLAMADQSPEQRIKTPMPPETMLPAFASDTTSWKASPVRRALLNQVAGWLRTESGRDPQLNELLAGGYEALRPCLPTQ